MAKPVMRDFFMSEPLQGNATHRQRSLRVHNLSPGVIRIESTHPPDRATGSASQIFFEDVTVLVDQKSHDAGIAVFCGIGDHCEAADHLAAHDILSLAPRCCRALAREDPVIIPVEWRVRAYRSPLARRRNEFSKRTFRFAFCGRPV